MVLWVIGLLAATSTAGASTPDESIARFTHDLGGTPTLRAYPPEPAAVTRQAEQAANRLYGAIDAKSPRTPYFCAWRDRGPSRFTRPRVGPPDAILLACAFGASPWSPPAKLADYAVQAGRRDEARVRIGWTRRDGRYVMDAFEVDIRASAAARPFRSVWSGAEVASVAMRDARIVFPSSPTDPLTFAISAAVSKRTNIGERATAPTVAVRMTGAAPPLPDWVLY